MPGHCGRIKDEKCESVGDRHSGTCTSRCSDTQGSFSFCKLQSSKSQILDCETHASSGAELTIQERRRTGKAEAGGKSSEPRGEVLCRRKSLKMLAAVGGKVLGQSVWGQGAAPEGRHDGFCEAIGLRDAWRRRKGNTGKCWPCDFQVQNSTPPSLRDGPEWMPSALSTPSVVCRPAVLESPGAC